MPTVGGAIRIIYAMPHAGGFQLREQGEKNGITDLDRVIETG